MDDPLIVINHKADLERAWNLIEELWVSGDAADLVRLEAQARLIAAYEEKQWPRRAPSTSELMSHFIDQH